MSSEQARSHANYYGGVDFDWDAYHKYRPEYPEKFFDLLFAYHQSTASGSAPGWDQAADFGSGPGTIVPSLLKRFRTAVASDLNETQIQLGRDVLLPKYGAQRIRLHVGKAEECDWLEDGTVDMITAAEAAHWFDDDKWVAQAARKLKSGGTIAFWLYFPSFALINPADPELVDLFTRLNFMLVDEFSSHPRFPKKTVVSVNGRLQNYFLDPCWFEKEQRHYWLFSDAKLGAWGVGDEEKLKCSPKSGEWKNRVGSAAEIFHHSPEPGTGPCGADGAGYLLERGPWTLEDMDKYLDSLGFDFTVIRASKEYCSVRDAIKERIGDEEGKFYVAFAMVAVLAKRK